jgi:hypothetical protein
VLSPRDTRKLVHERRRQCIYYGNKRSRYNAQCPVRWARTSGGADRLRLRTRDWLVLVGKARGDLTLESLEVCRWLTTRIVRKSTSVLDPQGLGPLAPPFTDSSLLEAKCRDLRHDLSGVGRMRCLPASKFNLTGLDLCARCYEIDHITTMHCIQASTFNESIMGLIEAMGMGIAPVFKGLFLFTNQRYRHYWSCEPPRKR